ncbi:MAG: glycosyltransferase family 2 protein [Lachnospiraceae bacterium]|nr:glycosyltransferase family 2 protein [Lachnospiraceae bacterium]
MTKISYVIPCYRSELTIAGVVDEINHAMEGLPGYAYEIILVNDGSPDNTMAAIRDLCKKHENITGIGLAKNFGQHAALMAGFRHVTGDYVICLDDDGQTPAEEAGKLIAELDAGRDVVYARYQRKKHSLFRNFGSKVNSAMTTMVLGKPKELFISSYFGAKRFIIDDVVRYDNCYPYVIALVLRATKNISNVDVHHRERAVGTSGYTFRTLMKLWFNGLTASSMSPIRFATMIGGFCAAAGFLYGIYTVIKKFLVPDVPLGFSALMAAVTFLGGFIILILGFIGEYVGRIYVCLNSTPQYVIRDVIGAQANKTNER